MSVRDDQFTYKIDIVDAEDNVEEHIAGANNMFVANRAYKQLLFYHNVRTILMLREGGRLMRREHGTGGWHREYIARTLGPSRMTRGNHKPERIRQEEKLSDIASWEILLALCQCERVAEVSNTQLKRKYGPETVLRTL